MLYVDFYFLCAHCHFQTLTINFINVSYAQREKSSTQKNTLEPKWNQKRWLLVQEPSTQCLHANVLDHDTINVKEMFKLNVIKGAASVMNTPDLIGRCKVAVKELSKEPGHPKEFDVPIGMGEFSSLTGCVRMHTFM